VENQMNQGGPVNGKTPVLNGRMVRSKRYKYCLYDIGKQREELFDLENDPGEMVNITTNKSSGKILREHRHYLEEFAEKNNDNLALQMLEYVKKERN